MNIYDFQTKFNDYAKTNNCGFSITAAKAAGALAEEMSSDILIPGKVAGHFTINNAIGGVVYEDTNSDITGIELITVPSLEKERNKIAEAALMYPVIVVITDIMSGLTQKRRDKLCNRLGLNNGTWVRGSNVICGGYEYRIFRRGALFIFEMKPIPSGS